MSRRTARHDSLAVAAANTATAPPCEVPSRSNEEMPMSRTKRSRRVADPRKLQSIPGQRSEKPAPNISMAYTVAYFARAGILNRQEKEIGRASCRERGEIVG